MKVSWHGLSIGKKLALGILLNAAIIGVIVVLVYRSFSSLSAATTYQTQVFAAYQGNLERLIGHHWRVRSQIQYLQTLESGEALMSRLAEINRGIEQSHEILQDSGSTKYERIHQLRFDAPESYKITPTALEQLATAGLGRDTLESLRSLLDSQPESQDTFVRQLRALPVPPKTDDELSLIVANAVGSLSMSEATQLLEQRFERLRELAQATEKTMLDKLEARAGIEDAQSALGDAYAELNQLQTPETFGLFEKIRKVSVSLYTTSSASNVVAFKRSFRRSVKRLERELPASSGAALQNTLEGFNAVADLTMSDLNALAALRKQNQLLDESHALTDETLRRMDALLRNERAALSGSLLDEISRFLKIVVALGAIGTLLSIGLGWLVRRSVVSPLRLVVSSARRVAGDDLRQDGTLERISAGKGETGELGRAFLAMGRGLREMVGSLQAGTRNLTDSAAGIATTAKESAAAAAEQASTVREVSATAQQILETTRVAAGSAADVVQSSERAVRSGKDGLEAVEEIARIVAAMNDGVLEISAQIERLGDLADQSNLLALNARIEASRAGEHGRGFSVVATEVRSLAERSKQSTAQIREILLDIQAATRIAVAATRNGTEQVGAGRLAIDSVRKVMGELSVVLEENSNRARQIAGAVSQQSAGVEQITDAVQSVANASANTSAGARKLEDSAESLSELATELDGFASRYAV